MKPAWQKNLRVIPPQVLDKINRFQTDSFVVSCALKLSTDAIRKGTYRHLHISWNDGEIGYKERVIPPANMGRYSERNRVGYEIVFRDLPKTTKTWTIESPNYGDSSKGYHDIEFTREVFQRKFVAPKLLAIHIRLIGKDALDQAYIFVFTVEEILDRTSGVLGEDLLFALNLLQESTGNHDVQESGAPVDNYLQTLYINWEILPPGEREETINRILSGSTNQDPYVREMVMDRYDFLTKLKPRNFIKGVNEFRRYFGAQFLDDLVVFENLEYGNAIYVMYEDWENLSKKSRTELLSLELGAFDRIPHTRTWKRRLGRLIYQKMRKHRKPS